MKKLKRKDYPNTVIGLLYLLIDSITILYRENGLCTELRQLHGQNLITMSEWNFLEDLIFSYRSTLADYPDKQISPYFFFPELVQPRIKFLKEIIKREPKQTVDILYILYRDIDDYIPLKCNGLCQLSLVHDQLSASNSMYFSSIIIKHKPIFSFLYYPYYFKKGKIAPRKRYLRRLIKMYNPKQLIL